MEFVIKTLTPIWTGGVETGRMDRIQETGIIGSLRWWYEASMRGLGGDVCNPTSDNPQYRCQFDGEAYQKSFQDGHDKNKALQAGLQNVCPICRLFGCTGWKRRFELSAIVAPNQLTPFWLVTLDQPRKFNHWWLSQVFKTDNSNVYLGHLPLKTRFIRGYEHYEDVLRSLLSLMADYGAIGAKAQYGFGQFTYPDAYSIEKSMGILRDQITTPTKPKNLSGNFYSLRDFWHLQCQIPGADEQIQKFQRAKIIGNDQAFQQHKNLCLPVSFDIRYKLPGNQNAGLRQAYRLAHGKTDARQVFGTVQSEEQKWGSRVFVSHLYKRNNADSHYQLRVWGFTDSTIHQEIRSALEDIFQGNINVTVRIGQAILNMVENIS
jgi:CRISPR-associated protein Cmr1